MSEINRAEDTPTYQSGRPSSLGSADEASLELSAQITELVLNYFAHLSASPIFPDDAAISKVAAQGMVELPEKGLPLEQLVDDCRAIINASRANGHPRFFGYVASPSTPVGAFADLLASAINQNVTSWRSAPAATQVERTIIRWLGSLIGYGEDTSGLLTSGGSMANLNALLIAQRAKAHTDVADEGLWHAGAPMIIYASDQAHLSIPKAAAALGLGRKHARLLQADESFRLDVRSLREQIESDRQNGFRPFCIVANAGTVNTGAIDPLAEIARLAREHELWLHVDGAYGAFGALDPAKRPLFQGIEQADSISLDPHKWLYAPVDCGCLLFRDPHAARRAFSAASGADYIQVQEETEAESFAFWDYGLELSRRFRALKVWLMLRYYGSERIAAAISEDIALAAYMGEQVRAAEDFELLAPFELSICCFRYVPPAQQCRLETAEEDERARINSELDELNRRIMRAVQRGGRAYLSNATLRGRFALRACITNFRTTREDVDLTLAIIREAARTILARSATI